MKIHCVRTSDTSDLMLRNFYHAFRFTKRGLSTIKNMPKFEFLYSLLQYYISHFILGVCPFQFRSNACTIYRKRFSLEQLH